MIDHRKPVRLPVRKAGSDEPSRPAVFARLAILDHVGIDRRLLDHVGKVHLVHFMHTTVRVADAQIAAQERELLFGCPRFTGIDLKIAVASEQAALVGIGFEQRCNDAHRDTGLATHATRPVDDRLAAPETDPPEGLVKLGGMRPTQFGKHFPFGPPLEIGTGARRRHKESGKSKRCAHQKTAFASVMVI